MSGETEQLGEAKRTVREGPMALALLHRARQRGLADEEQHVAGDGRGHSSAD